jgi:hypothetical protein
MHFPTRLNSLAVAALLFFSVASGFAQSQVFEVTGTPLEATWPTHTWDGQHAFPPVFCLRYPNPRAAKSLVQVMFNKNTLYLARVTYPNDMALYIATSVIPADRTPAEEVAKMLNTTRKNAQSAASYISVSELATDFGPAIGEVVRNSVAGGADAPFPFVRKIAAPQNGTLQSLSIHRTFVRGPDRIEVAGLQYFGSPLESASEPQAVSELSAVVDEVVRNLQTCTATMPVRTRK